MGVEFKELTLASACGGRLEEKFQEALAPCIEALEQPSKFVSSAGLPFTGHLIRWRLVPRAAWLKP